MSEHGPQQWVGDWSARRAGLSPDRTALVDATTGREFTYESLDRRANQCAQLLTRYDVTLSGGDEDANAVVDQSDVPVGGRVAVVSRNRPEYVDLFFATGKTGGVLAPISHRLAPPEMGELLATVDPSLLVVESPLQDAVDEALADTALDFPVLVIEAAGSDDPFWDTFESALPHDSSAREWPALPPSAPHLLLHTGGSTGTPKETVISHEAIVWNATNTITAWGLRPDDLTPLTFPMAHTGGWNVLTVPLFHVGGTVVIAREFDPGAVLSMIDDWDASILVAVPAVLGMMVDHDRWKATDLGSLRFVKSGGGPCRDGILSAWWDRDVDLSQGYGLTECGPNNFAMPDDWPREKADTVGIPAMHVDVRIVDEDGDECERDEVGELHLRSPHAASGYWQREHDTAAVFSSDGWIATGDLAQMDADGYVSIVGRRKNMFVSGGENVYPAEVEDAISAHSSVRDVVVVPIDDETWGQVGRAVVVGEDSLTLSALRDFLDDRLAHFKHPRSLVVVDSLPRTSLGKIDREMATDEFGG